jgi:phosphate starvation-inducible PhoH-like protein
MIQEKWCVSFSSNGYFSSNVSIQGPFDSEEEAKKFILKLSKIERYCIDNNALTEANIIEIVKGSSEPAELKHESLILHGSNGKTITARTPNQQKLVKAFDTHDMLFAIGPAGSGKTYTAIALAVRALKNKEVKKIILSRPAVEAGEKLGFLPGDMKEKIDPSQSAKTRKSL